MPIDKSKLTKVSNVYPLKVSPYEQYMGDFSNPSVVSKINSMVQTLLQMGRLTNQTVSQWNTVMEWIVNGGMDEIATNITTEKVEVALVEVMRMLDDSLNNGLKDLAETVTDTKIGELLESGQFESMISESLVDINEVVEGKLEGFNLLLAETEEEIKEVSNLPMQNKQVKPMILLIDDDGSTDFLTKLKPIYDVNGIKGSVAVNTSKIGTSGFMTLAQLKTLQDEGFEILNHGKSHLSMDSRSNDAERYEEVVTAQNYLKENGFNSWEHFVLGNGTSVNKKPDSFAFLKKYVKSAVNTGPLVGSATAVNNAPIEQFSIHRQHTPDRTLAQLTAEIDKGIASNGLIVFFTHAQQAVLTPDKITEFDQLIKYGKSLNIPFVTLAEALETFGNIVDTGTGTTGLKVSKTGLTNIKEANMIFVEYLASVDFNNSITTFPSNTVTKSVVGSSQSTNSPTPGTAGILITTKNSFQNGYNYQEWYPNSSDRYYKRRSMSNGGWETWKTFSPIEDSNSSPTILAVAIGANTKLVTSYTLNSITIEACSSANNPGLPGTGTGTLKTYRISDQSAYCYQEFTSRTDISTHKRFGNSDHTWGAWVQV